MGVGTRKEDKFNNNNLEALNREGTSQGDHYPGHHCSIPKCVTVHMRQRAGNGYERSFHYKNKHYLMKRKFILLLIN